MAQVEMTCTCSAYFNLEYDRTEEDGRLFDYMDRFMAAHVDCGYITPAPEPVENSGCEVRLKIRRTARTTPIHVDPDDGQALQDTR